jgi:choline-sulfatase
MSADGRPNILLLMVDQLGASWLSTYGHPVVRAPHLSALGELSTVFESAYTPSPLCAPARAALLSGRLPSQIGVYDNAAELRASTPTVAHHLRAAGYATCLTGKMHFVGPDQLHGFEERLTTDIYPADLDWTPDWTLAPGDRLPWYHTMEAVLHPGVCEASMQLDYDDEVAFHAVRKLHDLGRTRGERPFFLAVSFTHPHDPWEVGPRHWGMYDRDAIDPPTVGPVPLEAADPHSRRLREMAGIDDARLTDGQVRAARHGYYAAISYVDERIGEVLDALRASGLEEDTVVVFTADHGEMLGERGLWYKMSFFEPAARVPLMIRDPRRSGPRRVAEPVSVLDLAPTLLEVARSQPEEHPAFDGSSLAPLMRGAARVRSGVAAEYLAEGVTAPAVMVRRGRYKLVVCPSDPDQLYDLAADPHELTNLASSREHAGVADELRREARARWDLEQLYEAVLASQRDRRMAAAGLRRGAYTAWDFQPVVDASMQYVRNRGDLYELQRRARLEARTPPSTRLSPRSIRALGTVGQADLPAPRRRMSVVGEEEEP